MLDDTKESNHLLGMPPSDIQTPPSELKKRRCIMALVVAVLGAAIIVLIIVIMVSGPASLPPTVAAARNSTVGYELLEILCDSIGHRLGGSQALEEAIDFLEDAANRTGFHRVRRQAASIEVWKRNDEYLEFRGSRIPMLGLGGSVGTPGNSPLRAPAVVLKSFDELETRDVRGKIVVFNYAWDGSYGSTVAYRTQAAERASRFGALATLTRSITPISLQTPHTGGMHYGNASVMIPSAAITVEYAELFQRMQDVLQEDITLSLYMEASREPRGSSFNIIADILGSEKPEEIILLGGHADSWDVGQGAQDDGGGIMSTFAAAAAFLHASEPPKRTIRWVAFTDEEYSQGGAAAYFDSLSPTELSNHVLAIESDIGVFAPIGFEFAGTAAGFSKFSKIAQEVNSDFSAAFHSADVGVDIGPLTDAGVPGLGLISYEGSNPAYFRLHHTNSDTFDKVDLDEMQQCQQAMAAVVQRMAYDTELYLK